jgi:hypothetical protein
MDILRRLNNGSVLTARIPAKSLGHDAWLGIYPIKTDMIDHIYSLNSASVKHKDEIDSPLIYRLVLFMVDKELIENDIDISEYEMVNRRVYMAYNDKELLSLLDTLEVSYGSLGSPWKTGYPI